MRIRAAQERDIEGIAEVHAAAIRKVCGAVYEPSQIDAWLAGKSHGGYLHAIQERDVFVADDEGSVLGFSELEPKTGEVFAVYVRPDRLRRRVGSHLLRAVEDSAQAHGLGRLQLHSTLNAIPFYQAHGFELAATTTFPLGLGMSLLCARMLKTLPIERSD